MPTGGTLTIQAKLDEARQWLCLTIDDSGSGLARQKEMMACKSFYTTKQGNLGIGFIMVKQIMESFGGEANLSSRENRGTSVNLTFRVLDRRTRTLNPS
ncbi:ATP-binding protein [Pseudomonas sp. 11/12A]|jgi:two-component system sensor histidine kinase HydH|uniref:ATP-binding protein n=1 Tax=Pseudomonas sp. 11/12A TaxID=1506582 RepID=UPI001F1FB75C|nr:ATP-binding protein [Pseudomonas sp. 11/12A]